MADRKIEYPKWKYHRDQTAQVVHSKDEDVALGNDWAETPAVFEATDAVVAVETAAAAEPTASGVVVEFPKKKTRKKKEV